LNGLFLLIFLWISLGLAIVFLGEPPAAHFVRAAVGLSATSPAFRLRLLAGGFASIPLARAARALGAKSEKIGSIKCFSYVCEAANLGLR
jgi:hypothetical protein